LEFALVGTVEEAAAKRIDALGDYFDNVHEGRHILPTLLANDRPVVANEALLRFAIIEKNRIEAFARLAARPPAQASALIASLFGLDVFNDFVNEFTTTLDRNLRLDRPRMETLTARQVALEAARRTVALSPEVLAGFEREREQIAADYAQGFTAERLDAEIGTDEQPGRLQALTTVLEAPVPALSGVRTAHLVSARRQLRRKHRELHVAREELLTRAAEVSYRDLYRATIALQAGQPGACPACETPLERVVSNPYERAVLGLEFLAGLSALEGAKDALERDCAQLSLDLKNLIATTGRFASLDQEALRQLAEWALSRDGAPIFETALLNAASWRALLCVVRQVEAADVVTQTHLNPRATIAAERARLEAARTTLAELSGRRRQHAEDAAREQDFIANFDIVNAELIGEVAAEEERHRHEERLIAAYTGFYEALRQYRDGLPELLLAGLNETAKDLYNQFNADDPDNDKLAGLQLPLRGGERIRVSFRGSTARAHDALHVLSEGHLRCLGLAILLAKNIALNLPILIFDDAVNAIDHEHRAGLRNTIFQDPRFQAKQVLVTCHSNEFIKSIQNSLAPDASLLYILNPHGGDHHPRVQNGSSRHYLVRAQERYDDGDHRQCLASCRQALENLASRLWRSLSNAPGDLATLNLVIPGPGSGPELHCLVTELNNGIGSARERGMLNSNAWRDRHEGLSAILDIPERSLIWKHLNKGTHDEEDRDDFEAGLVRSLVAALGKISATFNT